MFRRRSDSSCCAVALSALSPPSFGHADRVTDSHAADGSQKGRLYSQAEKKLDAVLKELANAELAEGHAHALPDIET